MLINSNLAPNALLCCAFENIFQLCCQQACLEDLGTIAQVH